MIPDFCSSLVSLSQIASGVFLICESGAEFTQHAFSLQLPLTYFHSSSEMKLHFQGMNAQHVFFLNDFIQSLSNTRLCHQAPETFHDSHGKLMNIGQISFVFLCLYESS